MKLAAACSSAMGVPSGISSSECERGLLWPLAKCYLGPCECHCSGLLA